MPRRRLKLSYPSDEEDDEEQQQPITEDAVQLQESTAPVLISPDTNPNPSHFEVLSISDDDNPLPTSPSAPIYEQSFQPSPPVQFGPGTGSRERPGAPISEQPFQPPPTVQSIPGTDREESSVCPIGDFLWTLGLRLRREWLDSCIRCLESSVPGFSSFDVAGKANLCFEQFLHSDMNYTGAGVLPDGVSAMHLVDLAGPFVLQVDEIVNISCALRGRYQDASSGIKRCLKLSLTDGVQRVFGMEYRPINDLKALAPAGLKVAICNVNIRHGLLMLVPEVIQVLGGLVEELDVARKRLVDEVNKPPRGKRTTSGVIPSLTTRATLAAWSPNSVTGPGSTNGPTFQNSTTFQTNGAAPLATSGIYTRRRIMEGPFRGRTMEEPTSRSVMEEASVSIIRDNIEPNPSSNAVSDVEDTHMVDIRGRTMEESVPISRENNLWSNAALDAEDVHMADTRRWTMEESTVPINGENNVSFNAALDVDYTHMVDSRRRSMEESSVSITWENTELNPSSNAVEDIDMVDEVELPVMLNGDKEIPFTYMANLSSKWASVTQDTFSVQGKIKCFLTGVKSFQFKHSKTFQLRVYVDDGSLIYEIFVDHNVVQNAIGHSPEEVTSALMSSDKKDAMKEKMKQFQFFLTNFEGTVVIEMNEVSPLPVAIEMNQGCLASDAWLLLKRLKSLTSD